MENELKIKNIVDKFNLKVVANDKNLNNIVQVYGVNRPGLELAGFYAKRGNTKRRIILLSSKELNYIMSFSDKDRLEKYKKLLENEIPCVLLTSKFNDQIFIDAANKTNIPIIKVEDYPTSDFTQQLLEYMDVYFAPQTEIHGTLVNVYGVGVLIIGESGIGKSEISLELVGKNHLFVGDDRIVIRKRFGNLIGESHHVLSNLVEVRGLGIIDITKIFGYKSVINQCDVNICVELIQFKSGGVDDTDRLGTNFETKNIIGVSIPYIRIPVSSGRNIALIIENAVGKLKSINQPDYESPTSIIEKRLKEID